MFRRWTRDLHLYTGLFISPFLLVFAISVFFLNHAKVAPGEWTTVDTVNDLQIPDGIESSQGKDAVARAQAILPQVGLAGEIGFTRFARSTRHFVFPVSRPGLEANVDVDVDARRAVVSRRPTSLWEAFGYLHKMPGPHNVAIRGNWLPTRIWRVAADATIYLIFFITLTGLYLWWGLKAERRAGLTVLSAGVVTFFGLMYVFLH
jgi:hypothetical protein